MSDNKQKVVELLKSIETGDSKPVGYINELKYKQHNLAVEDGLAGFGKVLSQLPQGSARVNTVRVFADGDYVFAHTDYNFFGPKIGFDVFLFENGKITEHWDNLGETSSTVNPSGRTQIDGPTEVEDLDKTAANKEFVREFVDHVLVNKKYAELENYISAESYHQHNTQIGDNISGLTSALGELAKVGITLEYEKNHRILGEGNFVLAVSEGLFGGKKVAYYDLFRVKNNKIVEHWDIIEEIPTESQWKNSNGKF